MKLTTGLILAGCALQALAFPSFSLSRSSILSRAVLGTADDVENDKICKPAYLVFAKGSLSLELGNLGGTVGPQLCSALKDEYKDGIGCQGLNKYSAGSLDFFRAKGTSEDAIQDALDTFIRIHFKCPNSTIVASGWSQGAAVIRWAVAKAPAPIKAKIAGVALLGDAMNAVEGQKIEGFPSDKIHVFCGAGDNVCGNVQIPPMPAHWLYTWNGELEKATGWLMAKIGPMA